MPRGSAESGHARSGESRFGRGATHARHTPSDNMTCSDAAFKIFPDEKQRGGGTIFALDPSGSQDSKYKNSKSPFPHPQAELKRGERTDYLEGFQRPQGGDVRLDRRLHTTEAQAFAGTRALRTKSCVALLDTGSPASFIREKIWNDMLGSGAASSDGEVPTQSRRWGGFHGKPLTTSSSVRLNVLLGRKGTISCESSEDTPVRTVVWAHIVSDRVMSYDLLLGRDSWDHFPVRKYRDTNEEKTVVTFTAQDDGSAAGDHRFKKWVDQAIGIIESPADCKVVVRHADKSCMLSEGFTWVRVELRNWDGSAADPGSY